MNVERLASYLRGLQADTVGIHLTSMPELDSAHEACRLAGKTVVGLDANPAVVITADASFEDGTVRCLKEEVDELVPDATHVLVFRHTGDVPLAPTLDAYLVVPMIEGRDIWFNPARS